MRHGQTLGAGKSEGTHAAEWPSFITKLKSRELVAEGTLALTFDTPAHFTFTPGQFIDIELMDAAETDEAGNIRGFSISSAPQEEAIMITTRVRNTAFKRTLNAMPVGTPVKIEGPFGNFRLHSAVRRPAVFLAGGIGITPFRSMLLDAAYRKLPHRVFLFYCNRRPEDAPFLREMESLARTNANYHFVATMTQLQHSNCVWQGERGFVDEEMLEKYLKNEKSPIYYTAGPPAMTNALHEMLLNCGINGDDIRSEQFPGY